MKRPAFCPQVRFNDLSTVDVWSVGHVRIYCLRNGVLDELIVAQLVSKFLDFYCSSIAHQRPHSTGTPHTQVL